MFKSMFLFVVIILSTWLTWKLVATDIRVFALINTADLNRMIRSPFLSIHRGPVQLVKVNEKNNKTKKKKQASFTPLKMIEMLSMRPGKCVQANSKQLNP